MGHGSYSVTNSVARANATYKTLSTNEIFRERNLNNAMTPYGLTVRESRDSAEHPNSFAIVLGLDVTGSMGSVPAFLIKQGLPHLMEKIIQGGEKDPQILFLGIGDHQYDSAPLQVGQFESSDELLEQWLKKTYLESGGGGNDHESYFLAWYLAGMHTSIDCHEKRGRKGLLFTIGDERVIDKVTRHDLKRLMGEGEYRDYTANELLDKAREKYDVYHIHIKSTNSGSRQFVMDSWKELMSDNLLIANRPDDVASLIADTVLKHKQGTTVSTTVSKKDEEIL